MRQLLSLLLACTMLSACATSTTIRSQPLGAKAYVDEQYLGETPVRFSDSSPFWTKRQLLLKKDGYQDKSVPLSKNELRVGPLIGTILVLVPVFWLFGYPNDFTFEMLPAASTSAL